MKNEVLLGQLWVELEGIFDIKKLEVILEKLKENKKMIERGLDNDGDQSSD